jgi:hypothetical protein
MALTGCDSGGGSTLGTGTVQVFMAPEDTIPEGLAAGTGEEEVVDGWTVKYTKFVLVVGDFHALRTAATSDVLRKDGHWIIDLRNLPDGHLVMAEFTDATATRYDKVGYSLPQATSSATKAEGTFQSDYDALVNAGNSIRIAGELTKEGGQSCDPKNPTVCVPAARVTFDWALNAATSFDDCANQDGDAGFAVPKGGTVVVKPTVHGDHWFFTNITQGAELTERRAQWIADCDLDHDGKTRLDELKQVKSSDVFKPPTYNLSGALTGAGQPISTAYDYLLAQARTLGDYNGEGECPTREILE